MVAIHVLLLGPPQRDVILLAAFLLISGGITLSVGHIVVHFGVGRLVRTINGKLIFILMLTAALALVNVGFTSFLMFISPHDLALLASLLFFSFGMSGFIALQLSSAFTTTIRSILSVIRQTGEGRLSHRVQVQSGDEMQEFASAFNAMAEQLEASFDRLTEMQEARRRFIASLSHDLRTPLTSVRALVESINEEVVTDRATVRRYLHTIQREIEYLSRLIDDLFELSQIDAGLISLQLERASLQDFISDAVEAMSFEAQAAGVDIRAAIDETIPPVLVDTKYVRRVLNNLLQNSLQHTPADGTILVTASRSGDKISVSVADSGEGIPPNELPHIFDRLGRSQETRARPRDRPGLGLAIAKAIVEAHGGDIRAESVSGNGSIFTFTLLKAR